MQLNTILFSFALRVQTVHWIGAKFGVCMVQGFYRQVLNQVPKCKWIPFTKFPCTNTCKVNFVGTLVLLRIPQRANIGNCSEFRKSKRFPQMQVDSTNLCGFRLQLTDSDGFHKPFWIPQTLLQITQNFQFLEQF